MSKSLVILSADKSTPLTSTEIIAFSLGRDHKDVIALARRYKADLSAFGLVSFKTKPIISGKGGSQNKEIAFLNESQATFLITLMRNSPEVVQFKVALVKAFFDMREKLRKAELEKLNLRSARDKLKIENLTKRNEKAKLKAEKLELKLRDALQQREGLNRSQQYAVAALVNKKALELGCATAGIWKLIYERFKVPSYKMLKPSELPAVERELKYLGASRIPAKPGRLVSVAVAIREMFTELAKFPNDEQFMYDLMDTRDLLLGIAESATDSERVKSMLASITRVQEFFLKRRLECSCLPSKFPVNKDRDNNGYVRAS